MKTKLEYAKSLDIVRVAVGQRGKPYTLVTDAALLGDLLPEQQERHLFRRDIHSGVKSHGYDIILDRIPVEPHMTVGHLAVTLCELAGDPTTEDEELPGDPTIQDEELPGPATTDDPDG